MILEYEFECYRRYLQSEYVVEGTIYSYFVELYRLQKYLCCEFPDCEKVFMITPEILKSYIAYLNNSKYLNSTLRLRITILRLFFRFLYEHEFLPCNLLKGLKLPKKKQRIPNFLTVSEVDAMCRLPEKNTFKGIRDKAILELFYSSGLRLAEVVNIKFGDINYEQKIVKVTGKGDKTRLVPLTEMAIKSLKDYDVIRNKNQSYFFLAYNKRQLTRETVKSLVKAYLEKIGLHRGYSTHTLRHTFATHLLSNGCCLTVIQKMLGHSNISTTEIYTHVALYDVKAAFTKYHPRNNDSDHT